MNESPPNPPQVQGRWAMMLALCCGFLFAVLMAFQNNSRRTDGPVQFTYRQPSVFGGASPGVEFNLPAGWAIVYNGHQKWHGGSVVDASGHPRMEVWLHDISEMVVPPDAEEIIFPWGKARCLTRKDEMDHPFNSFPRVRASRVVTRDYYLDRGFLSFRFRQEDDAELKQVIVSCMNSLRRESGN